MSETVLSVKFSAEESAILKQAADASGLPVAEFCRRLLLHMGRELTEKA